jgi:hypothetical protein
MMDAEEPSKAAGSDSASQSLISSRDHASRNDEYSWEFVEALLRPYDTPNITDKGLEPAFTDEALFVMVIFQAKDQRLTADQISSWVCNTFDAQHYAEPAHFAGIRRTLASTRDLFLPFQTSFVKLGDWTIQPGLYRTLQMMTDPYGYPFDPLQYIDHHFRKLNPDDSPNKRHRIKYPPARACIRCRHRKTKVCTLRSVRKSSTWYVN